MFSRLRSSSNLTARSQGGVIYQGFLEKRGRLNTAFKKRWCVLKEDGRLYYYKPTDKEAPQDSIPLEHTEVRLAFSEAFAFEIVSTDRVYHFLASSQEERQAWMKALSSRTNLDEENGLIERAEEMICRATYLQCKAEEDRDFSTPVPSLFTEIPLSPPCSPSSATTPSTPSSYRSRSSSTNSISPSSSFSSPSSSPSPSSSSPPSSVSPSPRRVRSSSSTSQHRPKPLPPTPSVSSSSSSSSFLRPFSSRSNASISRSYSSPVLAALDPLFPTLDIPESPTPVHRPPSTPKQHTTPATTTPTREKELKKKTSLFNFSQQLSRRKKGNP